MKPEDYYQEKIKEYQHRLAADFERAKGEAARLQDEARREFDRRMADLESMREDTDRRARALMEAGHESWRDLERALADAYGQVFDATRGVMRRFGFTTTDDNQAEPESRRKETVR